MAWLPIVMAGLSIVMVWLSIVMVWLSIVMDWLSIVMAGLDPAIPARTVRNGLAAHFSRRDGRVEPGHDD
jgi:hypothetical protein